MDWIGYHVVLTNDGVTVYFKEETRRELLEEICNLLKRNVVAVKVLMRLAGRLNHGARLLLAWRPYLNEIHAACAAASAPGSRAPRNTVWTRQVAGALVWFKAFLQQESAGIARKFRLVDWDADPGRLVVTVDASPWGMGGVLTRDGRIVSYFAVPATAVDEEILGVSIGSHRGQQAWECLCLLIALRVWFREWCSSRCLLGIRGDNVTMLTMSEKVQGKTGPVNIIARELGLLYALAHYRPVAPEHLPGVANGVADALSRLYQEKDPATIPSILHGVDRAQPGSRPRSWWRTLSGPGARPRGRGHRAGPGAPW